MRRGQNVLGVGSGVLYRRDSATFIVTAWHNVTGRHAETLKPLHKSGGLPDNLIAIISCRSYNEQGFEGTIRRGFTIPLEDGARTFYLQHPQGWPRVDVVAIPINPEHPYDNELAIGTGEKVVMHMPMREKSNGPGLGSDIFCIQDFEPTEALPHGVTAANYLSLGSDLFILGYPKGIVDMYYQPLWKRATVASSPSAGWQRQKKFLVDCASRQGMSGAPAVTHSSSGKLQIAGLTLMMGAPVTLFHGIYTNRVGGGTEFEAQIGSIWGAEVIPEIIDGARLALHSSELELPETDLDSLIASSWPKVEGLPPMYSGVTDYADLVLAQNSVIDQYFTHSLMEKMAGRADPDHVQQKVREFAKRRSEKRQ